MILTPRDRLIFALDVPSRREAEHYVRLLKDHVGLFKVGLELFLAEGPSILQWIAQAVGSAVFLDIKLHDIPETVARTIAACESRFGPRAIRFMTIHGEMGTRAMRHIVEQHREGGIKILAVTLLTSVGKEELQGAAYRTEFVYNPSLLVLERARWAQEAGCAGVICSGWEAQEIREKLGSRLLVVTPGVRPSWETVAQDSQRRVVTPASAIRNGADYIVVGRPIRDAKDPVAASDRIVSEIQRAVEEK
jgi:orotidine-5'-phosphate decarboxylase